MRLKTFTAVNMPDAMRQVRAALGDEAIILSTEHDKIRKQLLVTAGVEEKPSSKAVKSTLKPKIKVEAGVLDSLTDVLDRHHLPRRLANRLLRQAEEVQGNVLHVLEEVLASSIAFTEDMPTAPLVLIGQPGAGKTVTAARLAARARLAGQEVILFSTDTVKAGGIEQLGNLARAMKVPLHTAEDPKALTHAMRQIPAGTRVFIDTAGLDPRTDAAHLTALTKIPSVAFAWVLPVSGDAEDMREEAEALATAVPLSVLLPTRLDLARRLGGVINAAMNLGLPIGPTGMSVSIAKGLRPLSAPLLAALMLADVKVPKGRFLGDAKS
ncbi:MAG: hypothetical protein ACK59C_05100 [Holosporales bacterium]|jgi:flagellar biosynthesis protein FlhF